jgi:putative tryptophan/tyrosine transport system substrate-binding protein
MIFCIRRREFIAALGSAAVWPLAARAQQGDRMRRIGVLVSGDENDPVWKPRLSAFTQALSDLGWTDGRNVRMDLRWYGDNNNRIRAFAQDLVGLQPDVILASATVATAVLLQETRTIPIMFVGVSHPVHTIIRPNITGFATFEPTLGGKWLELLSEIAPGLKRAAIMFNPDMSAPGSAYISLLKWVYMSSLKTAARSLKVEPITAPVHSDVEIETAIIALGCEPGGGLVVMPDGFTDVHRGPIILAAARNNVPAVYPESDFVRDGGLLSYGIDPIDFFRHAATYVDRILRGAKPSELPVQLPTKRRTANWRSSSSSYEMVLNVKTAKALGLTVPLPLRGRADELIE